MAWTETEVWQVVSGLSGDKVLARAVHCCPGSAVQGSAVQAVQCGAAQAGLACGCLSSVSFSLSCCPIPPVQRLLHPFCQR